MTAAQNRQQLRNPGAETAAFRQQAGKGRRKGVQNKTTGAVKDMVVKALSEAGGVAYLKRQAEKNPAAFLTLVGKVIPLQVSGDSENPLQHVHRIELVAPQIADDKITVELIEGQ
ncbi:MAG TPA: hypothetical protein VGQ34_05290 [Sphingomicrobium sp.]|nr:hypothetical protein [Sphingomicrobium sp.]